MSLDITKSVTLNGKSLEGTTSQGNMSASITKGQSLNMNIYLNAPENLDIETAKTDVIQFVAKVFGNALQVVPPKENTSTPTVDKSSSSSSKDTTADKSSSSSTAGTGSDSKETSPSTSGSETGK